ncbi:MAG: antibiotic biosynthesis monooxygenase [Burkholderiaceae bacterium]|nr:antibiotic biosynthesis monooxygenase [Burkholderiaceae bacterium]
MISHALLARFEAKPGKESVVEQLLLQTLSLANQEAKTPVWFALKISARVYGVFDAFSTARDRQAHLVGPIATALMENADELFIELPKVELIEVLGSKNISAQTWAWLNESSYGRFR